MTSSLWLYEGNPYKIKCFEKKCGMSDLEWREWPVGIWVWLYLAPSPAKPSHLNIHQPTIGLIAKRIKMDVCAHWRIGWSRVVGRPSPPSDLRLPCIMVILGTAPCNWKLTQEKLIFPATTILMCFIINYYFAINSVYQGGGATEKPNERAIRHSKKSVTQD